MKLRSRMVGPMGALLASLLALSCSRPDAGGERTTPPLPTDMGFPGLAEAKIFFGHQSVGYNIVEGASQLLGEARGGGYDIVETRNPADAARPGLYHCTVGTNGAPLEKMADFEAIMRGGFARSADIALMKLCYVDIDGTTDIETVFAAYEGAMLRLAADYPDVVFAWTTVPLTTVESGPKAAVKRILGRPIRGEAENLARERYNRLVREHVPVNAPLLDLALFESTTPGGDRVAFHADDMTYYALYGSYTSDGGHLDGEGRRLVAGRFLAALSAALAARR